MEKINLNEPNRLQGEPRYGVDCTVVAPHGFVATPWNRITIPRHCALPWVTATAHSTPSNRGF